MGVGVKALWAIRILFACRVSLLSVAAGALLFLISTQARDLFADIAFGALPGAAQAWLMWASFFAYLVFLWAFPIHYAARRLLQTDVWMVSGRLRDDVDAPWLADIRSELRGPIDWIPRLLAMVPFAAVLVGLWTAYHIVAKTPALAPARAAAGQIVILAALDVVIGALFLVFLWRRKFLTRRMSDASANALAAAYVVVVTAFLIAAVARPFLPADLAPRAAIVPVLFGGFVFLGTWLAWLGHKLSTPILTVVVVGALVVTGFNRHFNDVRTLPARPAEDAGRQIEIGDAVRGWMAVNCDALGCPPAVIIASEGGASRAAFAAATAIGDLLDRAGGLPDASDRALAPARRIFAISGVSGGSFGAATIRTALADSLARGQGQPPCQRPTNGWFGADPSAVRSSWRACLQALVAGDYLTPAFVGLGWRDNFSPPGFDGGSLLFADDRAALIERAWERHYDHVVKGEIPGFWAQVAQDLAPPAEQPTGLRAPFGFVAEKTVHANGWLPLLLLNATSVDTGTRIIASDLVSTRSAPLPPSGNPNNAFGRFSLYPAAFDVFEMLAPPCAQDKIVGPSCASAHDGVKDLPLVRAGPDLRLSTAALLSARFPIISPAGILRAEGEDAIGDRAVDGGYFENSGLTSAMDVARELRRFGVVPIVLWVQNDPRVDPADPAPPAPAASVRAPAWVPPRGASTPFMGASEPGGLERAFGVVIAPVTALTETRDGHGAEVAAAAQRDLWMLNQDIGALRSRRGRIELFRVRDVSKSGLQPTRRRDAAGRLRDAGENLACGRRRHERGVDELVAVAIRAGGGRRPALRPAQPGDPGRSDEPPVAALPGQATRPERSDPEPRRGRARRARALRSFRGVEVGSSLFSSLATGCTHLSCSPAPGPKLAGRIPPPLWGRIEEGGRAELRKTWRHFPRMRDRRDPPPCPAPARGAGTPTALERRTPAKRCVHPVGLSGRGGLRPASARLGRRFERLDGLGGVSVGEEARDQLRVESEGVEAFGGETDDVGRVAQRGDEDTHRRTLRAGGPRHRRDLAEAVVSRVVHAPEIGRSVVCPERARDQRLGGRIDRRHGQANALATQRRGSGGALDGHRRLDHDFGVDRRQRAAVLDIKGARAPPGLNVHLAGAEFDRLAGEAPQRRHRAGHAGRLEQRRIGRDAVEAAQGKPLRPRGAIGGVEQESQAGSLRGENTRCHWETLFGANGAQDHPSYAELYGLASIQMYAGALPASSGSGDPKLRSSGCGCRIARAPILAVSPTFSRRWANILILVRLPDGRLPQFSRI